MLNIGKLGIGILALGFITGVAFAKDDWLKVATLTAGGEAKEVAVNREISAVRIAVESGTVTVNTVVVREGGKKTPHTVGAQLAEKSHHDIQLGAKTLVTGLRISDANTGTYNVFVK